MLIFAPLSRMRTVPQAGSCVLIFCIKTCDPFVYLDTVVHGPVVGWRVPLIKGEHICSTSVTCLSVPRMLKSITKIQN